MSDKAPRTDAKSQVAGYAEGQAHGSVEWVHSDFARTLERELSASTARIEELERELRIAELKNRGTLANNLCPDHRDKQTNKSCLACTIETLTKQAIKAESALAEQKKLTLAWESQAKSAEDAHASLRVENERDVAIGKLVRSKLISGNTIHVERCMILASEVAAIDTATSEKLPT